MRLDAAIRIVELGNRRFLRNMYYTMYFRHPRFRLPRALAARLYLAARQLLDGRTMEANKAHIRLIISRIIRFRRMRMAGNCQALRLFADTAVMRTSLAKDQRITGFRRLFGFYFFHAIRRQHYS